jgi:glycosyltransferase involved in cell wall biosynthesis
MKIAVVCVARPDLDAHGTEKAAWFFSRELAKLGCEVHVFYPSSHGEESLVDNVRLRGVSSGATNRLLRRTIFFANCRRDVIRDDRRIDFDLISFHGPISLPLIPLLRILEKRLVLHIPISTVAEFRACITEVIQTFPSSIPIVTHFVEAISYELAFLHSAHAIVVPMEQSVDSFQSCWHKLDRDRFHVVPYGQDVHDRLYGRVRGSVGSFRAHLNNRKIVMFIGGTNWRRKGCRNLLYAYSQVARRIPSVLVIVGSPQEPYMSLMKKLGLRIGEDVIVTGLVSDEELALMYASCDMFTLPSLHEAFSQTVIEAMGFGKPVIVSPVASYPVQDGLEGYIVDPSNARSYAEGMIRILSNDILYAFMSKNARKKASQYSWDNAGRALYETYNKILHARL